MKKRNKHIGSSLEDFLKEEGILEETRVLVLKETLAVKFSKRSRSRLRSSFWAGRESLSQAWARWK